MSSQTDNFLIGKKMTKNKCFLRVSSIYNYAPDIYLSCQIILMLWVKRESSRELFLEEKKKEKVQEHDEYRLSTLNESFTVC